VATSLQRRQRLAFRAPATQMETDGLRQRFGETVGARIYLAATGLVIAAKDVLAVVQQMVRLLHRQMPRQRSRACVEVLEGRFLSEQHQLQVMVDLSLLLESIWTLVTIRLSLSRSGLGQAWGLAVVDRLPVLNWHGSGGKAIAWTRKLLK